MTTEREVEVFRQFTSHQDKYDYFLMSVAAAAIAFAVHRTSEMTLNWFMLILGLAVLLWAVSFLAGCRRRQYAGSIMLANLDLLYVQNGTYPEVGLHSQKIEAASKGILIAIKSNSQKASFCADVQQYTLISGAMVFIIWHAITMARN